jgi:Zn-dependent oligopeptidase
MKVSLSVVLEGKTQLEIVADIVTYADLSKLAKKITDNVASVKKLLPDVANKNIKRVKIEME